MSYNFIAHQKIIIPTPLLAMEQSFEEKVSEILIDLESLDSLRSLMDIHPLSPPRAETINTLSPREMDSLVAFSDTLLPSINTSLEEPMQTFFKTSASMLRIPETVGVYLSGKLQHPMRWLLRVALWFLSTWYGTFVICGPRSMSCQFPYFRKFSDVELHRREEIVLSLSHSSFFLYKMLFKAIKFLVLLFYFTQVDEKNQNPAWKALGYSGPDPDISSTRLKPHEPDSNPSHAKAGSDKIRFGPLTGSLVRLDHPKDAVSSTLAGAGISISSPTRRRRHPTICCDAVVIGSGSGGGVVAGVLATAGYKVVVVEKGSYSARRDLTLLEGHALDTMYEAGGLLATEDLGVVVLAGATVGGGSHINWAASIRTPDHVRREWCEDYELELFGSEAYKEAMDAICDRMGVQEGVEDEGLNNSVLRRGCEELGYPVCNIPRNSSSDHYCGWCCFGCKDGRKKGTSETWLVDMAESGNGVILPGCAAVRVLHHRRKKGKGRRSVAAGVMVEYENGEGAKETYVIESKVTVVACGALSTPGLLKRSGLKNRNIGRNLHLHPTVMAWGTFPEAKEVLPAAKKSYEGGIMTAMSTVVANMATTGYGAVIQTPALHPGMFSALTPWVSAADFRGRMTGFSRTAHMFALVRDRGSGTVDLPMTLTYRLKPSDEENLRRGVERMLRIMAAAGAEEVGTHHCEGRRMNVKRESSHAFERFVREESRRAAKAAARDLGLPVCSAHQMGSCRMGVEEGTSVVDQRGEAWEVEGLYVADTSVFPTALGVNPMITVMSIAYCTAQAVKEVLHRRRKG